MAVSPALTSTTASTAPVRQHVVYLDGIRGLAALWVMIGHAWQLGMGYYLYRGLKGIIIYPLLTNHLAVDVFIVLSGFCLMLPVAKQGRMRPARQFLGRRAQRILPPFFLSIFAVVVLNYALSHSAPSLTKGTWIANLLLLQDVFPKRNILNGVYWSVALEWKIYFLFPLLVLFWQRRGPAIVLASSALLSLTATAALFLHWPGRDFSHTCPWYFALFTMGLCAGGATSRPKEGDLAGGVKWLHIQNLRLFVILSVLAVLGFMIALPHAAIALTTETQNQLVVIDVLVGIMTAFLLLFLSRLSFEHTNKKSFLIRVLSWRPLVLIGTFGYSLYLTHMPVLLAVDRLILPLLPRTGWSPTRALLLMTLGAILATGISYLFFLCCERPFLNRRKRETMAETERDAALSPAP